MENILLACGILYANPLVLESVGLSRKADTSLCATGELKLTENVLLYFKNHPFNYIRYCRSWNVNWSVQSNQYIMSRVFVIEKIGQMCG